MGTDSLPPEGKRPPRRHVRARCTLTVGASVVEGYSRNISATGISVRLTRESVGGLRFEPGLTLMVRINLPEVAEAVESPAEVVWIDPHELELGGKPAIGLGMRLLPAGDTVQEHLRAFMERFRYTVMVVDDEQHNCDIVARALRDQYRVLSFTSASEALHAFEREDVALVISDSRMPDMTGTAFLRRIAEDYPESLVVRMVLTAYPDLEEMQQLINVGKIFHYLRKPFEVRDLVQVVRRGVDAYAMNVENERLNTELERANRRLERENAFLRRRIVGGEGFERILGASPALREALAALERIRHSGATVHITGETGTGKELVARALHEGGPHKSGRYVTQNCAGMTETLLQSTLFGHKKGAFTGAVNDSPGVFQEADGGTLFLDEVAELSAATQAALLRALQEGEIVPVGASRPTKVSVRVISATHKDLREEVRAGRFREDLYFRLVVIAVRLPPLRERQGDVPLLARHFLDLHCEQYGKNVIGFAPGAMVALERYPWPGNVRELENEIQRLVVLADEGGKIARELLSPHIKDPHLSLAGAPTARMSYDEAVINLERQLVGRALEECGGVVSRAAALLQMERSRFGKLRRRLGLG